MDNQILYIGDTEGISGYAQAIRRSVFCLQDYGANVVAKYVHHDSNTCKDSDTLNRIRSLYGETGSVVIHQQIPHMINSVHNCYNIGSTMFEASKIPDEWIKMLGEMDEIWVPSIFNKTIFIKSGVTKNIFVVPFPVDTNMFRPRVQKKDDIFRFLSIFQWTDRKNWRALLSAYFNEFSYADNVELYLKVYLSSDSNFEKDIIQNQINSIISEIGNKNRPKYILDFSIKTEQEIIQIHQNSDVFVLPSCGEAVGLTYLESMACGNPCIATGWGGQTEFIDSSNGYLADYDIEQIVPIAHIKEYRIEQQWANVRIESLRKQMRTAFKNRVELNTKGIAARKTIEDRFSFRVISGIIMDRVESISKGLIKNRGKRLPDISYRGDIFGLSGYSTGIRLNIKALKQLDLNVGLFPVYHDRRQIEPGILKESLRQLIRTNPSRSILIDHQTPEFFDTENIYSYKIGFTYFETSRIPPLWVDRCNKMDEIWLASEDAKAIFINSGVSSHIEVIPPFLDTDIYNTRNAPLNIQNKSAFTFLSVFEFIPRKGWDVLIEAFAKAFNKNEDVCLIIKTHRSHPPMTTDEIRLVMKQHLENKGITIWPKILLFTTPLSCEAFPHLYTACDAFVLPTRGEAICYPALEAMASGKPCIITGGGGQESFITQENGYIINYETKQVKDFNHSPWYTSDQNMTEPSVIHLINTFRDVYNNREELRHKGILARRTIELKHSLSIGSTKMRDRLYQIARERSL